MIGKPYSGKLNVRFDEGELEIEHGEAREALSDERDKNRYAKPKPLRQFPTLPDTCFYKEKYRVFSKRNKSM